MRSVKPVGVLGAAILLVLLFLCLVGPPVLASGDSASSPVGSWHLLTADFAEEAPLTQVQIIDPSLVYGSVKGALYWSTDGGFNWSLKYRTPADDFDIERFFFLDEKHGWMVESSFTEGGSHGSPWHHFILRTTDGGRNWTRVDLVEDHGYLHFPDMVFFDQSTGFLVGGGPYGIGAYVWKTEDGGLTWDLTNKATESVNGAAGAMSLVGPQHGWLLVDRVREYEGPKVEVYRTTDGGLTWLGLPGCAALMPSSYARLSDLDFVDVSTGWAVGDEGTILHTDDAGLTWKKQSAPTTKDLNAVDFLDSLTGWVVGEDGTILHTRDGGRYWQDLSPVGFSNPLGSVQYLDESHGWALTYDGKLLRYISADSGEFWDVPGSRNDIHTLAREGIVQGYDDGSFRPDNPVLRAQLAKMLVGALRIPVADGAVPCPFSDVPKGSAHDPLYPDDYVAVAAANGIVQGFTPTSFGPYQPVTCVQMVSMVVRALERLRPGRLEQPPADWRFLWEGVTDSPHGQNVRLAEYNGLLGDWLPWEVDLYEAATRGEMAQLLYAALGGELAPLWPLKVSKTTLAELARELKSRFPADLPIYLPRQLPAGWGIAESPLPKNPWLWRSGATNPLIEDKNDPYYVVFTDGSTAVELLWPIVRIPFKYTTSFHQDGIIYSARDVHMEPEHDESQAPVLVRQVHLRSQIWALDAIRAIADALEEVRR